MIILSFIILYKYLNIFIIYNNNYKPILKKNYHSKPYILLKN